MKIGEKIALRFIKLKKRGVVMQYHVSYVTCELLNIVAILICFHITDCLLNKRFWSYGTEVNNYFFLKPSQEELQLNPGLERPNPMCSLFPTEVACNYCAGSIGGGCNDRKSILCILSNNLFNQYYFLFL